MYAGKRLWEKGVFAEAAVRLPVYCLLGLRRTGAVLSHIRYVWRAIKGVLFLTYKKKPVIPFWNRGLFNLTGDAEK